MVVGKAGSVQGIAAMVTVRNTLGLSSLIVDDSADPAGRAATINAAGITGLAPAAINYTAADLRSLTVNGGTGGNTFIVTTTPGNALVAVATTINSGAGSDLVNLLATAAGTTLAVNTGSGINVVNIGSIPVPGGGGNVNGILGVTGVSGAGGKTQLDIDDDGHAPGAVYAVTAASVARPGMAGILYANLASLVLNAGVGGNVINVLGTALGTATTINAGSAVDVINVGSIVNTLDGIHGPLAVVGRGANTLNLRDSGNPRNDSYGITAATVTRSFMAGIAYAGIRFLNLGAGPGSSRFTVLSTAPGTATTISTGAGADVVALGGPDGLDDIHGPVAVTSAGILSLVFNDQGDLRNDPYTLTATTLSRPGFSFTFVATSVTLNAGPGSSSFNVLSTAPGTTTTINTGAGNDVVSLGGPHGLDDIAGPVAAAGAGTLALVFNDGPDPRSDPYTITSSSVSRPGFSFQYAKLIALALNAGAGSSTFTIRSTAAGTATVVNAGAGNDVFNVGNAAGSLAGIQGPLALNGQAGADTLNVSDHGTTGAQTYTITSSSVTRSGAAAIGYGTIETLNVNGGRGGNTVNVQSTAAGVSTTVSAGTGNDVITVGGPANSLAGIRGALAINGQGGTNSLALNDQGTTASQTYKITSTTVTRGNTATISYAAVSSLILSGGRGANTVNVQSTAAATPVTVNTGAGTSEVVNVGSASNTLDDIKGTLTINGQGTANTVALNDQGSSAGHNFTITPTTVARRRRHHHLRQRSVADHSRRVRRQHVRRSKHRRGHAGHDRRRGRE